MEKFKSIFKGVIISIVLTIGLLFCYSLILANTNINEQSIKNVIIIISAFAIFISSIIATKKLKKDGIINGVIISSIYIFILYIISGIVNKEFSISKEGIIMIIGCTILGISGGIIGTNLK